MRLRNVLACLVVVAIGLAAGCSRLTFVKPKFKNEYHRTAPDYTVRDDPKDAQRIAAIDQLALAQESLQVGRLDEAQSRAEAARKADPESADPYTLLAMIQDRRGNVAQAGTYYAKAAELAPTQGAALNNYGAWLCGNGRPAESLALFDRALADQSYQTPVMALANAGSCALDAGQDARASRDLGRALQLDPNNPVALAAMALGQFRAGHYLEARAFSERRLEVAPASVKVLQLASQIEQKLGDTAAAARYVQRIGAEFPRQRTGPTGDASQR